MCMLITALVPYDGNRWNVKKQASTEITTQALSTMMNNDMTGKMVASYLLTGKYIFHPWSLSTTDNNMTNPLVN